MAAKPRSDYNVNAMFSYAMIMRVSRAVFIALVMTLVGVLSYSSWTLLQDSKVEQMKTAMLSREISKLHADAASKEQKSVVVQNLVSCMEAQACIMYCTLYSL